MLPRAERMEIRSGESHRATTCRACARKSRDAMRLRFHPAEFFFYSLPAAYSTSAKLDTDS